VESRMDARITRVGAAVRGHRYHERRIIRRARPMKSARHFAADREINDMLVSDPA